MSISSIEFEEIRNDIIERLKIKLKTGVCSELIIDQFARHNANLGEKFGDIIENYNVSEILNLIEKIEDNELVGRPFDKLPLKGYYHIHHNAYSGFGSSLARNVKEYWFKRKGIIRYEYEKDFEEILNLYNNGEINSIPIAMQQKAIYNKKLNGEWLIYKIVENKKYYLCLALHREGKDRNESDENIFSNKISKCLLEFPELNNIIIQKLKS